METDFPALEVKQLDEEPVRRRGQQQQNMDSGGGDRVYQGWRVEPDKLGADSASKGVF